MEEAATRAADPNGASAEEKAQAKATDNEAWFNTTSAAPVNHATRKQPKAPIELYVSFGGLLFRLRGDAQHLEKLHLDSRVYMLIRRIQAAA